VLELSRQTSRALGCADRCVSRTANSGSGTIDIDEFFDMIKEQRSPLTDALFALIGEQSRKQWATAHALMIAPAAQIATAPVQSTSTSL